MAKEDWGNGHLRWGCEFVDGDRFFSVIIKHVTQPEDMEDRIQDIILFYLRGTEGNEGLFVDRERSITSFRCEHILVADTAIHNGCAVFVVDDKVGTMRTPEELSKFLLAPLFFPSVKEL